MNFFYRTFEINFWEIVALLGLAQSLWLLVYMLLRSKQIKNVSLALACFLCLSLAFIADFGSRYLSELRYYPVLQDLFWLILPACSALLAIQIAKVDKFPAPWSFLILLLPLIAVVGSWAVSNHAEGCDGLEGICNIEIFRQMMAVSGVLTGGLALLCVWLQRTPISGEKQEKHFKSDRYWAIIALIITNCGLMILTLAFLSKTVEYADFLLIRDILGCALVYLSSTSLFRIYPQTLKHIPKTSKEFNEQEGALARKIENLLAFEKVYQEQGYGRDTLARELKVSESQVTKIVNAHFGKSVPQLINEKRVIEAQGLLLNTESTVSAISEQVGFSSLASFNRVFKEITGLSPTEFRLQKTA